MSDAIRWFLLRVVIKQAFLLELKVPNVPNVQTRVAMDQSRPMMANRPTHFVTNKALFADLETKAASKRASLPWAAEYIRAFPKDWQRLTHSGRHNILWLKEALLFIANDARLGPECLDHAWKGDWVDHRECHIGGDFLLIY